MANKTLTGAHSFTPESEWGEERIEKVRKFVGRDKDSLTGKAKDTFTSKTEPGIHSPCLTYGQQVFNSPQEIPCPSLPPAL